METLHIVLPAYNEAENIESVVEEWHLVAERIQEDGIECRIVIANDGSTDDTLGSLSRICAKHPLLIVLDKPNSGHGATCLYLYRYAIEQGANYVFQTDSDGQTLPEEFWQMWHNREKASFHIGTREGRQDGFSRVFVTKTLRLVVRLMFGVWVKDANTPFRLMKTDALYYVLMYIPKDFFLANVAISAIAVKKKMTVQWYPITFRPRQGGVNSINMKRIVKIGWQALGDFRKINKCMME